MLRYLNMFVLIGLALIGISIAGFVTNNRFLMEPGQPANPWASAIYLGAGVLMLVNGYVSIRNAPQTTAEPPKRNSEIEPDPPGPRERTETTAHS